MGFLDFLYAGAVINSVKKARHNDSQQTLHGRVSDYDHGYEDGYDDSCYEHGYHEDCDCHDTYDCAGYNDDCCENDCNWQLPEKQPLGDSNNKHLIHLQL